MAELQSFNDLTGQMSDAEVNSENINNIIDEFNRTVDGLPSAATPDMINVGTDESAYITAASLAASANIPNAVPGNAGNLLQSDGTNWQSVALALATIVAGGSKVQSGVAVGSNSGDVTVTYLTPFSATPVMAPGFVVTTGGSGFISITSQSASGFTFATLQNSTTRVAANCNWIAIGT